MWCARFTIQNSTYSMWCNWQITNGTREMLSNIKKVQRTWLCKLLLFLQKFEHKTFCSVELVLWTVWQKLTCFDCWSKLVLQLCHYNPFLQLLLLNALSPALSQVRLPDLTSVKCPKSSKLIVVCCTGLWMNSSGPSSQYPALGTGSPFFQGGRI